MDWLERDRGGDDHGFAKFMSTVDAVAADVALKHVTTQAFPSGVVQST